MRTLGCMYLGDVLVFAWLVHLRREAGLDSLELIEAAAEAELGGDHPAHLSGWAEGYLAGYADGNDRYVKLLAYIEINPGFP